MKNNNRKLLLIWVSLVAIVLMAFLSFAKNGTQYIGKSYQDGDYFQNQLSMFIENLSRSTLNPLDIQEEMKKIVVTQEEIEQHRTEYGSLANQIENIEEQYRNRIEEAKANNSEKVENALISERDAKIEDISQNFKDDEHVKKKIRAEKERVLLEYVRTNSNGYNEEVSLEFAYKLKNIESGEVFTAGDMTAPFVFSTKYNADNGYLNAHQSDYIDEGATNISAFIQSQNDGAVEPLNTTKTTQKVRQFAGEIRLPRLALNDVSLKYEMETFEQGKYTHYILWIAGIVALIALFTVIRFQKKWILTDHLSIKYNWLKLEIRLALLFLAGLMTYFLVDALPYELSSLIYNTNFENWLDGLILIGFLFFFLWATVFQLVLLVDRLKTEGAIEQEIRDSFSLKLVLAFRDMFLNRSIGLQMFILMIGFFLAGIGIVIVGWQPFLLIIYMPLALFIGLPMVYIYVKRVAYLNRIMKATEEMANGRLNRDISVQGKSPLTKHAVNLNNLREGVRSSMTEQAKSERLKTELITNVSHDLRTPLTSIITYTDLLKNPELPIQDREKYVDIIDRKSQRLKTLIEDLFEVSKMASGNLELTRKNVDLTQLLQQALAEHAEQIAQSDLDFRTTLPETALIAFVDGQKWWRVLDNLIMNAIKYTLPGTRVYTTLRKVDNHAEFVVKNVTKYEISENVDELFERFKRADASRHTEGSGLGLAIAQSIVDLHNGEMKIEVDGDLFKVTVKVPLV